MRKYFILFIIIGVVTVSLWYFFIYANKPCKDTKYIFDIQRNVATSFIKVNVLNEGGIASIFNVDKVPNSVNAVQTTNCYIYVVRDFSSRIENDPYRIRYEMWRYDTDGRGKSLMLLLHTNNSSSLRDYSHVTAVSYNDKYIALNRFDPIDPKINSEDALVIKRLKNMDDHMVIPLESVYDRARMTGELTFSGWSRNNYYLWFSANEEALVKVFGRVDVAHKIFDIYRTPDGTMGGDALNLETGWVTYDPRSFWCGEDLCTDIERRNRIAKGEASNLHIYNLFTEKDILVESTKEDPLWWFKPRWLSDSELEYELLSGQKKSYNVETGEYKLVK